MSALAGKAAIVTGGTSGIGAAIATMFIAEGARVVIAGRRRDKGEQVAATLGEAASFIRTDVCIEDDVAAMVRHAVERFGRLDCLVNNAGSGSQRVGTADIHQKCHHALADTGSATQQPSLRQSPWTRQKSSHIRILGGLQVTGAKPRARMHFSFASARSSQIQAMCEPTG